MLKMRYNWWTTTVNQHLFQQQADTGLTISGKPNRKGYSHCEIRTPPTMMIHSGTDCARQGRPMTARGSVFWSPWAQSVCRWTGTCYLECEAARVILRDTAGWSGWPCLRSAQLLLPLILNRCLQAGALSPRTCRPGEIKSMSSRPAA